jgi:hypothetical protein
VPSRCTEFIKAFNNYNSYLPLGRLRCRRTQNHFFEVVVIQDLKSLFPVVAAAYSSLLSLLLVPFPLQLFGSNSFFLLLSLALSFGCDGSSSAPDSVPLGKGYHASQLHRWFLTSL